MGFLEKLMKMFGMGTPAEMMKDWEKNMTLEDIDELEKQGIDVTEYRKKYEEREAEKAARQQQLIEAIDLSRLDKYTSGSLDPESDFVKDTIALNKLSKNNAKSLLEAKLMHAVIVQAHYQLWDSEDFQKINKGAVILIATDEKYRFDHQWLRDVANKISDMKQSSSVPEDNKKLIKALRNDQSYFCYKLGASLVGEADVWCATFTISNQEDLPNSCLPPNRVLPLFLLDAPEHDVFINVALIPAKYYAQSV